MIVAYYCRGGKNPELQYSLRSICTYLNYPILIVGDKPDWCFPDEFVKKAPGLEKYVSAHQNILEIAKFANNDKRVKSLWEKALTKSARLCASTQANSSSRALESSSYLPVGVPLSAGADEASDFEKNDVCLMMDDVFLTTPYTKNGNRGYLEAQFMESYRLRGRNAYNDYLARTIKYLKDNGIKDALSYEMHAPFYFNSGKMLELFKKFGQEGTRHELLLIRSIYGNLYHIDSEKRNDIKFLTGDYSVQRRLYRAFSTNEETFKEIEDLLSHTFPNKCRAEIR